MKTKEFIVENKVIVICRKVYGDSLLRLAEALYDGGVKMIEVTFDQADPDCTEKTTGAMRMLQERFRGAMRFGAGTVLTTEQVDAACEAGGEYMISPNTNLQVIARTKELGLVSIPGTMTPTEILTAHDAGADFVKLFPASYLGMSYVKDITAPISHVKLLATGGVNETNFGGYLDAGFVGAGVSSRLADRKLIAAGNFEEITARARAFAAICAGQR